MKNIIFDWSGVVRDTVTSQLWIVNRIFEKYRVGQIGLQEFRENWEQPYILFYQKYLPKDYVESERVELFRDFTFDRDCPKSLPYHGMVELMQKIKAKGYFIAIVSSDLSETLLTEIQEWGLEGIFDQVITDADDKLEAVQKLIKDHSLSRRDTIFVGDSNHEIDVSKKTGIKSIAVTWGFTSEQKLQARNPDCIVHNPQELERIIV
jgi:phosphoglycolate phosphatase